MTTSARIRALAISGNWWSTRCWLADRDCLGPVEAGTYMTNRFNPFGDYTFGELEFTVPAGWAVWYDSQALVRLTRIDACREDSGGSGLAIWHDVAAAAQDCSVDDSGVGLLPAPDAEFGAAGIADFLEALPTVSVQRSDTVVGNDPRRHRSGFAGRLPRPEPAIGGPASVGASTPIRRSVAAGVRRPPMCPSNPTDADLPIGAQAGRS